MKKVILVILFLFSCVAYADRTSENLGQFTEEQLCSLNAVVNGVSDDLKKEMQTSAQKSLIQSQILYNLVFPEKFETCIASAIYSVDILKLNSGAYIYVNSLSLYTSEIKNGSLSHIGASSEVGSLKFVTLWDSLSYGYAPTLQILKDQVIASSRNLLEDFVLDWRAAHPK
jgi:hypothetical protein